MAQSLKALIARVNFHSAIAPVPGRNTFPQQDLPNPFRVQSLKGVELFEITVEILQRHLTEGHFSSADYVKFCLERIRCVCKPFL